MLDAHRAAFARTFALGVGAAVASFVVPFLTPGLTVVTLLGPVAGVAARALPLFGSLRGLALGYGGTVLIGSIVLTATVLGRLGEDSSYTFSGSFGGFSGGELASLLWVGVPFYQLLTGLTLLGYGAAHVVIGARGKVRGIEN